MITGRVRLYRRNDGYLCSEEIYGIFYPRILEKLKEI